MIELIKAHEGQPLPLEIAARRRRRMTITVTPQQDRRHGADRRADQRRSRLRTVEPGPIEALKLSVEQNWEWTKLIVQTLGGLFTRETSVKQLMGPVAIADLSGDAAEQGWMQLFSLMAMISLNLGLLNLMPIPVLDGGHIAILALEGLVAPRLQHEGEGEDAARRLRAAADADGHGHLQRPDAHPVDRAD